MINLSNSPNIINESTVHDFLSPKNRPLQNKNVDRGALNSKSVIPFNQSDLVSQLDATKNQKLLEFVERFNGLCELVCNRILIDDILGKNGDLNSIKNCVTLERMDEEKIKKSHILDLYSVFHKSMAFTLGIYPDNLFSCFDQWKLVVKEPTSNLSLVNRKILGNGLKNIKKNETLKLETFCKEGLSFSGHSLLIKKMSNRRYNFFDPNTGEHHNLSFKRLSDCIDAQLKLWKATDILLMKGEIFLEKLENSLV